MTRSAVQIDAFATPGTVLRAEREKQGYSAREAADRLNLMPDYVDILERDDYESLRSPQFARGYIRAYARLLGLDEQHLMDMFDEIAGSEAGSLKGRVETRELHLHRTGLGVVVGLGVLALLVFALWWWGDTEELTQVVSPPLTGQESLPQFVGGTQ